MRETFTVRKQSFGVGVERMFPVHSPKIERIELAARGDVRRAKLYYLRDRVGKRARVRERRYTGPEETVEPGLLHEPDGGDRRRRPDRRGDAAREARPRRRRGRRRPRPPAAPAALRPRSSPRPRPRMTATPSRRRWRRTTRRRRARDGDRRAARPPTPVHDAGRRRRRRAGVKRRAKRLEIDRRLGRRAGRDRRSSRSVWRSAIQAFVVKPYRIPSGSMEPTLAVGQRVLVDRIGMHFGKPHVGEIAVFHPPEGRRAGGVRADAALVKLGGAACAEPEPEGVERQLHQADRRRPGDTISIVEGHVYPQAARARGQTPTSAPCARARSATSRRRSRFPPVTGS